MTCSYQGLAYLMPPKHMDGMSMAGVWRGKYEQTRDQFIIEKHASIISRGSAVTIAKFDKDKQIEGMSVKLPNKTRNEIGRTINLYK